MMFLSNRFVFKQILRRERAREKSRDKWHTCCMSKMENHFNMSAYYTIHSPPTFLYAHHPSVSCCRQAECGRKDDLSPRGLDIADILSGHLRPRHHMFLLINVFLVLWGVFSFFLSVNNTFHCIVFVSWMCAKWLLLWSAKIDYNKWDNLLNTPLEHTLPSDAFLHTVYVSDAFWYRHWQQLWSWELKAQQGSQNVYLSSTTSKTNEIPISLSCAFVFLC